MLAEMPNNKQKNIHLQSLLLGLKYRDAWKFVQNIIMQLYDTLLIQQDTLQSLCSPDDADKMSSWSMAPLKVPNPTRKLQVLKCSSIQLRIHFDKYRTEISERYKKQSCECFWFLQNSMLSHPFCSWTSIYYLACKDTWRFARIFVNLITSDIEGVFRNTFCINILFLVIGKKMIHGNFLLLL